MIKIAALTVVGMIGYSILGKIAKKGSDEQDERDAAKLAAQNDEDTVQGWEGSDTIKAAWDQIRPLLLWLLAFLVLLSLVTIIYNS